MEIKINNYTIHYIEKEANITEVVNIDYSEQILVVDEFSSSLVNEIHKSISESPSLKNTRFKDNETNLFTNSLNDYLSSNENDDFYTFSKSLDDLKSKIEKEPFATGGYYLFVDYEVVNKRYISVVLLRKKNGINIFKQGNVFKVDGTENINIDKIAMAFRLNYDLFLANDPNKNYLAIISTQKDGIASGYFIDWVSAGGLIKNSKNTASFVSIIKTIDIPIGEDGKEMYTRSSFQKAVYDSVNLRKDKIINMRDLGKQFYGEENENKFFEFAVKNDLTIDPEFKRDSKRWKGLVTIIATIPGITLNVDYLKINSEEFKADGETIIIKSKKLVDQIKKQYEQQRNS
jgi:nucleoid-associated protein